jgi:hypothetical protein
MTKRTEVNAMNDVAPVALSEETATPEKRKTLSRNNGPPDRSGSPTISDFQAELSALRQITLPLQVLGGDLEWPPGGFARASFGQST